MKLSSYDRELKWRVEHLWMLCRVIRDYFDELNIKGQPVVYFCEPTLDDLQNHWRDYLPAVEDEEFFDTLCLIAKRIISKCEEKRGK